jgi:hypothetical protein
LAKIARIRQECGSTAVAKAHPNNFDFRRTLFFILADNDATLKFGVAADLAVASVAQSGFQDMLGVESTIAQILRQLDGQLVMNDEFHDAGSLPSIRVIHAQYVSKV